MPISPMRVLNHTLESVEIKIDLCREKNQIGAVISPPSDCDTAMILAMQNSSDTNFTKNNLGL